MTETANMGRGAAIYNETYLYSSSSSVPRRVRRREEIGETGCERGEERSQESVVGREAGAPAVGSGSAFVAMSASLPGA